jgi:NHLM bacteriocin system ABC transporter ATP-binding protein
MVDTPKNPTENGGTEDAAELFLLRLRYREGRLVKTGGNKPFVLDDPEMVWVVYSSQVDIFAVHLEAGEVRSTRTYLCSVEPGQALFGLPTSGSSLGLLAVGLGETELIKISKKRLVELARDPELTGQVIKLISGWVNELSASIATGAPPKLYEPLKATTELSLKEQVNTMPLKELLWVKHLAGNSHFMGRADLTPLSPDGFLPISNQTWLQTSSQANLCVVDTPTFVHQDPDWTGLNNFHHLLLECIARNASLAELAEQERQQYEAEIDQARLSNALINFASILNPQVRLPAPESSGDPLFAACFQVGQAIGLTMHPHPDARAGKPQKDPLGNIARASKVRMRRVALRDRWWRQDNGPMLAYIEADKRPVALLPVSNRRYSLYDPADASRRPVKAEVAHSVEPFAYIFYRPLPGRPLTGVDLLNFGFRSLKNELMLVGLMALGIGLLGLIPPKLTELLFDNVIPGADRIQLFQLSLGLVAVAFGTTLFELTKGFTILRVESKVDGAVQAALWDRLLRLPVSFFRGYTSGDLADRANGISAIRQVLTGAVSTVLSGIFSLVNFFLLFWYSWELALVALGLTLVAVGALALASYFQIRHQRQLIERQGKISGMVLQFISAISKFRVSGTENRAFTVWARQFVVQRQFTFSAKRVANGLTTFNSVYPVITSMVIFSMLMYLLSDPDSGDTPLSLGSFLGFNAAFGQFLSAALQLTCTTVTVLSVLPIYERTKPILEATPEVDDARTDPGELTGDIEVSHVGFRYTPDGPLILDDVSLHIKPREFVAFVGASGAGKSTLFRLLLGFEKLTSGSIYYDGQDLDTLDTQAVRQQTGTVLQHGQLMPGNIFANIVGSSPLSLDEAWEAARMAGLEEDIKRMPMGMHTVISEGAGTFSGGQKQRLLIARAIVNKPRIIFFDEATSALDNRTQAVVSQSLERLQATRIVIAHRLSTIVNADRIYVFENGKIVQQGNYQTLIDQPGPFAELAKRQLA